MRIVPQALALGVLLAPLPLSDLALLLLSLPLIGMVIDGTVAAQRSAVPRRA